jgi:phosphoglycerol transferase MdoB-like AlkP superfamily enzyme
MPTVADLVGANISQVPHMGRSLFTDASALVPLTAYFPKGTFLNDNLLYVAKSGSAKAGAFRVVAGGKTGITGKESADLKRSTQLRAISDSWLMSLPKFNAGKKGWIPDPIARLAAKKYGFMQH